MNKNRNFRTAAQKKTDMKKEHAKRNDVTIA